MPEIYSQRRHLPLFMCSRSFSRFDSLASSSSLSMPLSFKARVRHIWYFLNKGSHSSDVESPRRNFSLYHFRKHESYRSLTSLHSDAKEEDMVCEGDSLGESDVKFDAFPLCVTLKVLGF